MSERSVQLNIRTAASVAEALREEALRRDVPLGDVLEELLLRARASTETGVWITLPSEVQSALQAVASSRALEPAQVLTQMVAGQLRQDLLELAASLAGPAGEVSVREKSSVHSASGPLEQAEVRPADPPEQAGPQRRPRNPAQGLPLLGDEEDDEEVGIFTVFE